MLMVLMVVMSGPGNSGADPTEARMQLMMIQTMMLNGFLLMIFGVMYARDRGRGGYRVERIEASG